MSFMISRLYTTEGIILKRKNWGEADKLLTVFTRQYGKLNLLAKGVRRITSRRSSHVEILQRVLLTVHRGKVKDIITEATSLPFVNQKIVSLEQMGFAYYLCEIVDKLLPEAQEHSEVFEWLRQSLSELYIADRASLWHQCAEQFTLRLLCSLGYLPPDRKMPLSQAYLYIEKLTEKRLRATAFTRYNT